MKTLFGPKSNVIIVRISALLYSGAEILPIITMIFGPYGVFIKSFQFLLTFTLAQIFKLLLLIGDITHLVAQPPIGR